MQVFFSIVDLAAAYLSLDQVNMVTYESWILVLMVFPDFSLRYACSVMFITFSKIRENQTSFTYKYIGSSDELDLMRYFLYMTFVAVVAMVSF